MSAFNVCIMAALLIGVIALIAGFTHNKSSSFDDGSFIVQIVLMVGGGGLIVLALLVKFIASLFG